MPLRVTSLARYPIKGCRGHHCDSVAIDPLGVVDDRRLMLVDAQGRFLSQRELPRLATIAPALRSGLLTVQGGGGTPLELAITPDGPLRPVQLWGNEIWATDQGDEAAKWFTDALRQPCRLVWFGPGSQRLLDPTYSPRPDAQTAFADGYPILAVLEESLADLNARLPAPIPMNRFRPNVVLAGEAAWSEDDWQALTIGALELDAVKPCARCLVPTTDQSTGARHATQEPLRTLATFRTIPGLGTIFGQNLVPRRAGTIQVGDTATLHLDTP